MTTTKTPPPHTAGLDCPLCGKPSSLFFNMSGAMGEASKGAWVYFGCKSDACGLVVYNSKYLFDHFSPTEKEYSKVINPMIRRWNKLALRCRPQKSGIPIPEQHLPENVPPLPAFFEKVFHEVHGNGTMQKVRRADEDINGMIETGIGSVEVGIRFVDGIKWLVWSLAHGRTHIGVKAHRCTLHEDPPEKGERVIHDIFGAGTVDYLKPGQRRGAYSKQFAIGINFDRHGVKEMFWSFCAGKVIHLKKVKKP